MLGWQLEHTYTDALPASFYSLLDPKPVPKPELVCFNHRLATELSLQTQDTFDTDLWAKWCTGASFIHQSIPFAQAYAGHQFGHFTMLGDGRAMVLGEQVNDRQQRFDVQLKGSGGTPYARRGDGKATLSAMLREWIVSEAMHALQIPTTRSLAVAKTGEWIQRNGYESAAVLTRIAQSHLRVGTFEYAAHIQKGNGLSELLYYAIDRHYPELNSSATPAFDFLKSVMLRQIDLIVQWMRVGFVHGVMNTDNMSICGETIDYGPCAFLDAYDPQKHFSSIDTQGRYAFGNQSSIAQWNLACLAGALMPLLDPDQEKALSLARSVLSEFPNLFEQKWLEMMCFKLGIAEPDPEDKVLVDLVLKLLHEHTYDYTLFFSQLQTFELSAFEDSLQIELFQAWFKKWNMRIAINPRGPEQALELMKAHNPFYIPRNHWVEQALFEASQQSDFSLLHTLCKVLQNPYTLQPGAEQFLTAPDTDFQQSFKTFCGT